MDDTTRVALNALAEAVEQVRNILVGRGPVSMLSHYRTEAAVIDAATALVRGLSAPPAVEEPQ